jgi:hypothetical protein
LAARSVRSSAGGGRSSDLTEGFLIAIVLNVIVIPWPYVFAHYIKKPGDRWRDRVLVARSGVTTG